MPDKAVVVVKDEQLTPKDRSPAVTAKVATREELVDWFVTHDAAPVLPVGAGSKSDFRQLDDCSLVDVRGLEGIVAYDPSEFLITARAGTSIAAINAALAERGQYLPADPAFVDHGATLGGCIASGISGPSRLLFGALRDFVMEVEFLDGLGRLVRGGGKVVKNAAGFDFPKLMVGSLGRLGILTEITLKVFPRPAGTATIVFTTPTLVQAMRVVQSVQTQPIPLSAASLTANNTEVEVQVRVSGPMASLEATSARVEQIVKDELHDCVVRSLGGDEEHTNWLAAANPARPAPGNLFVRTCQHASRVCDLDKAVAEFASVRRYWSAGEVGWFEIESSQFDAFSSALAVLKISGMVVPHTPMLEFVGDLHWLTAANRLQSALDPSGRFLKYG